MKRRHLVLGIAGGVLAGPLAARAQQEHPRVIGFLNSASAAPYTKLVAAFRAGLRQRGYVEGQNLAIEFRWAESRLDRLPALAAELVHRRVAVIAASGGPAPALAAKAATGAIPIVFTIGADPVKLGLVASFGHPGANVTGVTFLTVDLDAKRLGLLRQLVPHAGRIAVLFNPKNPDAALHLRGITAAAHSVAQDIILLPASDRAGLEKALAQLPSRDTAALLVGADPFFLARRRQIVALVARLSLPAIYELPDFVQAGGLISYGASLAAAYRRMGSYVGRILKGEKPADLPVQQPTKFELAINLKTAKGLGLTVPPLLMAQADEVIR